ncbi:hypothetical protein CN518_20315 [Bacillus anthracis]|nr:hypothetical protein CN518_20315 [Bacillus anthracis]
MYFSLLGVLSVIEAITKEKYAEFSPNERQAYVLERLHLEDLWLIGRVRNMKEEKPFFFIDQLQNPYTGVVIEAQIFTDLSRSLSIFCPAGSGEIYYEDGTLVIAKVKLTGVKKDILKGNLFNTTFNEVYPIEDSNELFNLLDMKKEDLRIIALAKPSLYEDGESRFIDVAADIVKAKIADDLKEIDAKNERNEARLLEVQKAEGLLEEAKQQFAIERKHLYSLQQKLEELGFVFNEQDDEQLIKSDESFFETPETPLELLKGMQAQLSARGYHYEEKTLGQLLLALMTEQMIILSGPSGTGKTTIVKQFASIVNAKCEIIPVQPSWTDKQDLLGFYNPIRQLYVPSAFLDCLIEAKQNAEQLYIICLDEMNLAQIEYYLADLLSVRELEGGQLRLYSDFEYKQNMNEIKWFVQRMSQDEDVSIDEVLKKNQMDSLAHYEMVTRYENLKRYAPLLDIPSNVRIIGTMNVDGAVQALSPKVIDRSFIIPLYRQKKEKIASDAKIGQYHIPAEYFTIKVEDTPRISTHLREAVNDLQLALKDWQIEFNERVEKHILLYHVAAENLGIPTKQQVDDITVMKFLPRLHEMVEDKQLIAKLNVAIERHVKDELLSKRKLEKMEQKLEQTGLFSYWS